MENKDQQQQKKSRLISFSIKIILVLLLLSFGFVFFALWYMIRCEGDWQEQPLEEHGSINLAAIRDELIADVTYIQELGPRNSENQIAYEHLRKCEAWIIEKWESQGYTVGLHDVSVGGQQFYNIKIEIAGAVSPSEIVIISAQYDTEPDSPGANNNGSGMAVLFQLSKLLKNYHPGRTLRLIAFVNEQNPFAGTEMMGSYHYAKRSFELKEDIKVMLSMDALGIYRDSPGTQRLPFPFSLFYPDRGNFLAFIGNLPSRSWVKEVTAGFKKGSSFPLEAGVAPEWVEGVTWSDHSSFYKFGYRGMQITDTGAFRSASHGTREDTIEKINFVALSRIVVGMYSAVIELTSLKE
ncbi:MAG: M28 family peptidase [Aliifodinibius sp.]|nr:M28 family peptidase [Fodinibius sp.]NIV13187.1 M28 family peptidase [Fodinibius sp.]NIY26854.1 M28 family peptidase [Fodinibius sp.]